MIFQDKEYPFISSTSMWTIAFSTIGGIYKANTQVNLMLNAVDIEGSFAVATYAFVSAVVGYCTKKAMDFLFEKTDKKEEDI